MWVWLKPPDKPVEIATHVLALERRLVVDVSTARVDVELHRLVQCLQSPVELPSLSDWHTAIVFAVLDQERRGHLGDVSNRRMRCQRYAGFPRYAEILSHDFTGVGRIILLRKIADAGARGRRFEPA